MHILKAEILSRKTLRYHNVPIELTKETVTVLLKGVPEDFKYYVVVAEWLGGTKIRENSFIFHESALADHRFEQETLIKLLKGYNFVEDGEDIDIAMFELKQNTVSFTQPTKTDNEHRKLTI